MMHKQKEPTGACAPLSVLMKVSELKEFLLQYYSADMQKSQRGRGGAFSVLVIDANISTASKSRGKEKRTGHEEETKGKGIRSL